MATWPDSGWTLTQAGEAARGGRRPREEVSSYFRGSAALQALGVSVCCFVMFPFLHLFSENSLYVKCNPNLTCMILGVLTNSYLCNPNADQDVEHAINAEPLCCRLESPGKAAWGADLTVGSLGCGLVLGAFLGSSGDSHV